MTLTQLVGKIEGVLKKEFLFASFLPTIVLFGLTCILIRLALGEGTVAYFEQFASGLTTPVLSLVLVVAVLVVSYLLAGLRGTILGVWCGRETWFWLFQPLQRKLELSKKRAYLAEREKLAAWNLKNGWAAILDELRAGVRREWNGARERFCGEEELLKFRLRFQVLFDEQDPELIRKEVLPNLVKLYQTYNGESLVELFKEVQNNLRDRKSVSEHRTSRILSELDRGFGRIETIRCTRLGNIVEAYQSYAFKRYGMEGELLWPHLMYVVNSSYTSRLDDLRIQLDSCLTMATVFLVVGIWGIMLLPWYTLVFAQILLFAVIVLILCYVYYRASIRVAFELGDYIRGAFDLFREDLVVQMNLPLPKSLEEEKELWGKVNKLVLSSHNESFDYAYYDGGKPR